MAFPKDFYDIDMQLMTSADPNFKGLLLNIPVPVLVYELDENETVRFISPSFTQSFGYSLEDIPTVSMLAEFSCPNSDYRSEVMRSWRASVDSRRAAGVCAPPVELRIIDKSGVRRDVLFAFSLNVNLVIVTAQDITNWRRAEAEAAAERESAAYALTENLPVGAYTTIQYPGDRARFQFISKRFLDMLGVTRAQIMADPDCWHLNVHPDDREAVIKASLDDRIVEPEPFSQEFRIHREGATTWVRDDLLPRTLRNGALLWEGVLVDITRLKETEQRLHEVITASRAMTWHVDLLSARLQFNETWQVGADSPTQDTTTDFLVWLQDLHPDDLPKFMQGLEKLWSGAVSQYTIKYRKQQSDGQWVWFQVHAGISARDENGLPIALSGVNFDITAETVERQNELQEKWRLREDLQRAQQRDTVAQIAGNVAHDLNNIISVIAGTTEMLMMQGNIRPETMVGLDRIWRSVRMALDLVDGLGSLMRPDYPREAHDLGIVITGAVEMLGDRRIARHGVRVDLPETPPAIWGSPTELAQVILNLAINACDSGAGEREASVVLKVFPAGTALPQRIPDVGGPIISGCAMAMFSISDTGLGISQEVRSRMFRPHFTTKGLAGTGLGLPIVSSILQGNDAALWLDSTPGEGTTMTVAWPASEPASATDLSVRTSRRAPSKIPEIPHLDGMNVLVVDDVSDVGAVLADMLEAAGAVSVSENDPLEAQRTLKEAPGVWSVLVTDLHMSALNGRDLARLAAQLSPPVPVVLVTARAETLHENDLCLFACVLKKPVTAAKLAWAVQAAMHPKVEKH
jgi:PAS domain S-box-containing protein